MLKIVSVPNEVLSNPTLPVQAIDQGIVDLIAEMKKTLISHKDPKGVGLAANQVGKNLSLFIIKPTDKSAIRVFINPKILKVVEEKVKKNKDKKKLKKKPVRLEGCLSIPRIWGPVKRADKVLLEYQDLDSEKVKQDWFSGFEATIIQHEVDHLQGIVFTQRSMEQNGMLYKEENDELIPIEF